MDFHCTGTKGHMSDVPRKMAGRAGEATTIAISPRPPEGPGAFDELVGELEEPRDALQEVTQDIELHTALVLHDGGNDVGHEAEEEASSVLSVLVASLPRQRASAAYMSNSTLGTKK